MHDANPPGGPVYGASGGPIVDASAPGGSAAPGHAMVPQPAAMPPGRLEVEMKFFPLGWLLYFFSPRVGLNG